MAAAFMASGCASTRPALDKVPDTIPQAVHAAYGGEAAAETELALDWAPNSMFVLLRAQQAAPVLPKVEIKNLSFAEVGVQDAVRLLAARAGLTVRVDGGSLGSERYGPVTMENLSGSFGDVLNEMADAAGFFWELKGKTLVIRQDDQFMVNLPPALAEDTLAGATNTLQFMGARDVYLDRASKTLAFTANRKGMESIQRYLENVRANHSLLVYDTHVLQVELNDGLDTGIQWNKFGYAPNTAGLAGGQGLVSGTGLLDRVGDKISTSSLTAGAGGIGLAIANPHFTMAALMNFLSTQGSVKSLSSPQITLLSGSKGVLRVGRTIQFVSKVGSNTTTGISQVTTETSSLRTGLSLQLQGDLYDKTVFTHISLAISDITDMTRFTAVGTDLTLPQSADRDLEVTVRARPGDVALLGGIHIDSENSSDQKGLTGFVNNKARHRSELVLVLKTRVIRFAPRDRVAAPAAPAVAPTLPAAQPAVMPSPPVAMPAVESRPAPVIQSSEPVAAKVPVQVETPVRPRLDILDPAPALPSEPAEGAPPVPGDLPGAGELPLVSAVEPSIVEKD